MESAMKWKPTGRWSFSYWATILITFAIYDFIIAGVNLYIGAHGDWWKVLWGIIDAGCGVFMLYLLVSRFNDR